jgi:hypothetical protein
LIVSLLANNAGRGSGQPIAAIVMLNRVGDRPGWAAWTSRLLEVRARLRRAWCSKAA